MPYIQTGAPQSKTGNPGVSDVYHSPNVFANNVEIALWKEAQATAAYVANLSGPEISYVIEAADVDGIEDTNTATTIAQTQGVVDAGTSTGLLVSSSSVGPTTQGSVDNTPPANVKGNVVTGDWAKYNQDNIPYSTLMLTPKTSLADFTLKTALWNNQPKPMGPDAVYDGKGDNKHLKEQEIVIKGQGVVGRITVPQILHNLSNLAANIWEPFKAQYPRAIITNTFRQNKPGGSMNQAQHGLGMAMDIQIVGASPATYFEAAKWCRDNLPFDQLLQEKAGSTIWIHISHYSGYGYQVKPVNKVANMVVSPTASFTPGLALYG